MNLKNRLVYLASKEEAFLIVLAVSILILVLTALFMGRHSSMMARQENIRQENLLTMCELGDLGACANCSITCGTNNQIKERVIFYKRLLIK